MDKRELWETFAKTGDVEVYEMYLAMKEYEDIANRARREDANSRPES